MVTSPVIASASRTTVPADARGRRRSRRREVRQSMSNPFAAHTLSPHRHAVDDADGSSYVGGREASFPVPDDASIGIEDEQRGGQGWTVLLNPIDVDECNLLASHSPNIRIISF